MAPAGLLNVPDGVLIALCARLELEELAALSASCTALRALLGSPCEHWHRAFVRRHGWLFPELAWRAGSSAPSRAAVLHMHARLRKGATVILVGGTSSWDEAFKYPLVDVTPAGVRHTASAPAGSALLTPYAQALAATTDCAGTVYALGGWVLRDHALNSLPSASLRSCQTLEATAAPAGWRSLGAQMAEKRAFPGAACVDGFNIFAVGGGTSPWWGARCHASTELYVPDAAVWRPGPPMLAARCGLAVVHDAPRGVLYALGGYGGGREYNSSVEMLPLGSAGGRGWLASPPMSAPRSGLSASLGPDGRIFAVGGTGDGTAMSASTECFDPRDGRWRPCAPLPASRGFHAASFGIDGRLFVFGGDRSGAIDASDDPADGWRDGAIPAGALVLTRAIGSPSRAIFAYDPRKDAWHTDADGLAFDRCNLCAALLPAHGGLYPWAERPAGGARDAGRDGDSLG